MVDSAEVPFVVVGNRRGLTDRQLVEHPELAKFIDRFRGRFEYDHLRCVWILQQDMDDQA